MTNDKPFSERLADAIAESGETKAAIIKRLEIPHRTLFSWLSGERVPPRYVQEAVIAEIKKTVI